MRYFRIKNELFSEFTLNILSGKSRCFASTQGSMYPVHRTAKNIDPESPKNRQGRIDPKILKIIWFGSVTGQILVRTVVPWLKLSPNICQKIPAKLPCVDPGIHRPLPIRTDRFSGCSCIPVSNF